MSACVRLGASTGTSGRPTLILWTRKDLEVDHAASARGRWRWGLRPGMSLANAHPFGMNAGGWHFSHGVEALGVLNIPSGPPVGAAHVRDVIEVWRRLRPDMYRLFGNVARTYADAATAAGLDPARDLNLTLAGDHPSEQYLMASSGLEALPLLGSACDERDGAHLAEDLAIVEVIDATTGRARGHGERGNLVVTVLEKDNFLLRYDLEDVVRWNWTPCPCGETHRRLFYEGRVRDVTTVAGAADPADRRGARPLRVPRGVDAVGGVPDRAASGCRWRAPRAARARRRRRRGGSGATPRRSLPRSARRPGPARAVRAWCAAAVRVQGCARRRRELAVRVRASAGAPPAAQTLRGTRALGLRETRYAAPRFAPCGAPAPARTPPPPPRLHVMSRDGGFLLERPWFCDLRCGGRWAGGGRGGGAPGANRGAA